MERPEKPAFSVGQRVQMMAYGGPIGTIWEILAADTTYWYRIKLDNGRTITPGEQWLKSAPEPEINHT